jgi:hypothetical protein
LGEQIGNFFGDLLKSFESSFIADSIRGWHIDNITPEQLNAFAGAVTPIGGEWFWVKNATKGSQILSWGNNAKGHLIKHADVLGFGENTPQQLQKMLPQLRGAANQLYNNIDPALSRIGRWGGQTDDVLMQITNNGKMLVTKQNGEFITVIDKTSNNWYQLAKPLSNLT